MLLIFLSSCLFVLFLTVSSILISRRVAYLSHIQSTFLTADLSKRAHEQGKKVMFKIF